MSDEKKTCFVVMGFGKKMDYQTGRSLDLDKSYKYIIKPAATTAGLDCKRADEIPHSGVIDVPMYDQLLSADVVIADISTSNVNAFYELGVRHALRPYTTITIAEDKMMFPFDVSHLAIRKYQHLGDGIDYGEVERMRAELVDAMQSILKNPQKDSPIYTFFADLEPPVRKKIEQAVAQSAPAAVAAAAAGGPPSDTHDGKDVAASVLMDQANAAIAESDFISAKALLKRLRPKAPRDPYVAQRLALATYKSQLPNTLQALQDARAIVAELEPNVSTDTETLGLWGSIHKQLWELNKNGDDLDTAISALEKGFYLNNNFYNGINLAFLYDVRASTTSGADSLADTVTAQRVRRRVLNICDKAQATVQNNEQRYWLLATMAQAWTGLHEDAKAEDLLAQAGQVKHEPWMEDSSREQIEKLKALLAVGASNQRT